ncbi:hypothetical protein [Glycomyces tenuis]|uniref:hypothetical protein n=3 Tax=Glycomyces tenuis TaxID=58116 RepID=UPI0003F59EEC|nr:hypothetical protein [Glycomyces tenuis]
MQYPMDPPGGGANPGAPAPGSYRPQPLPPGPVPGGFPPPARPGRPRWPLAAAALAAGVALGVLGTVLVTGVLGEDEQGAVTAPGTESATAEAGPTTAAAETSEPEETAAAETAAYTSLENVCAVIEPIAAEYMTVDSEGTVPERTGDDSGCEMVGEFTDAFERPGIYVTQSVFPDDPAGGVAELEFQTTVIGGGCEVTEDAAADIWERSVYFTGAEDCVILGHTHRLLAASGNMYLSVEIWFGGSDASTGDEFKVLTAMAAAIEAEAAV